MWVTAARGEPFSLPRAARDRVGSPTVATTPTCPWPLRLPSSATACWTGSPRRRASRLACDRRAAGTHCAGARTRRQPHGRARLRPPPRGGPEASARPGHRRGLRHRCIFAWDGVTAGKWLFAPPQVRQEAPHGLAFRGQRASALAPRPATDKHKTRHPLRSGGPSLFERDEVPGPGIEPGTRGFSVTPRVPPRVGTPALLADLDAPQASLLRLGWGNGGEMDLRDPGPQRPHLDGPNNSTVANGSADQGRNLFSVNFVVCPGFTSTRT